MREASLSSDRSVFLDGVCFIPHLRDKVLSLEVSKSRGVSNKPFKHSLQLLRMECWQARLAYRGAGIVVKLGKQGQSLFPNWNHSLAMTRHVPFVAVRLDSSHDTNAIMGKAFIYGLGME
jgi:hypothetical protein